MITTPTHSVVAWTPAVVLRLRILGLDAVSYARPRHRGSADFVLTLASLRLESCATFPRSLRSEQVAPASRREDESQVGDELSDA